MGAGDRKKSLCLDAPAADVMELSRESGILAMSDEVHASTCDDHDYERATPDVRAPSRSWSLVF
jgi:hypothetical protein